MRIISFESARVTRLFPLEEFTPAAGANSPSIISLIAQRYGFAIVPTITTREDLNKNGLVFGMGHFQYDGQPLIVTDFAIYTDGLAAVAQRSEWAEAFLDDVTSWVRTEFGFREISSPTRKLYSNSVVVDFENSPSRLVRQFKQIADFISDRTVTLTSDRKQMNFARLDFEIDKMTLGGGQVATSKFTLERRAGVGFEQERYFSSAPMTTADHIETLEQIERVAARST
jgi:hypothetical protein